MIHLPEEIKTYKGELSLFINMMLTKLRINRHKGFGNAGLTALKAGLDAELEELDVALAEGTQEQVLMECVDVANMSWLVALSALRMDKTRFNENMLRRPK